MIYYSVIYKYKKDDQWSIKHLFTHESPNHLTSDDLKKLIEDLLNRKEISYDEVDIGHSEAVTKEKYDNLKQGVGIDMDEQAKKAK